MPQRLVLLLVSSNAGDLWYFTTDFNNVVLPTTPNPGKCFKDSPKHDYFLRRHHW